MRNIILLAIICGLISCNSKNKKTQKKIADNQELIEIYNADQGDRRTDKIDWNVVGKRDSIREARVCELLDSNMVLTSKDYNHAAMVFQHGGDSVAFGMAVKLMRKSIELDSTANKWLLAAAIDRNLLSRKKPQIYGTQYWMRNGHSWEQRNMDTTLISDAERIEYGVGTLAQQKEKLKRMNKKNK